MRKGLRLRSLYRYMVRNRRDPESMARGLGLGLFIGFLPSFGVQIFVALAVAGFFNANRLVAAAATLVTNPLTTIPLSIFSVWLGDVVLPGTNALKTLGNDFSVETILNSSYQIIASYLVGCLILATIAGSVGYVGARCLYAMRTSND